MQKLFYELILVALGQKERLFKNPSDQEWSAMYDMAEKQAVAGIAFLALDKLSQVGQKPPLALLYEWIGLSEQTRNQNQIVNQRCKDITRLFADAGFHSCILKGQGNAMMYPEPSVRTSGDIDIWIDAPRNEIRDFVTSRCQDCQDGDMHIDFPIYKDVPIEVHYTPRVDVRPKYNKRLQQWIIDHKEEQFSHTVALSHEDTESICVPTLEFSLVQQMSHIMGHFFVEGIGLRQFIDYYYLLKNPDLKVDKEDINKTFRCLGLEKFAKGVMWIEQQILGLQDEYLIIEPNEWIGKVIQKEMEEGGNFGHHDQRYAVRSKGILMRGLVDSYRLLKLAYYFPEDALWKLWNKIENQKWKLKSH